MPIYAILRLAREDATQLGIVNASEDGPQATIAGGR